MTRKARSLKGDFQFIVKGGSLGGGLFPGELYNIFHSGTTGGDSHGYNDPELDKLLEQARETDDPGEVIGLYQEIDKCVTGHAYRLGLAYREQGETSWNDVKGYRHIPAGGWLGGVPLHQVWLEE